MCLPRPPRPPAIPPPRPTAPAPERTAKTVVTGRNRRRGSITGPDSIPAPRRTGTRSLRIPRTSSQTRSGNLNY